jgi:hypothetical protein
MDQGDESRLIDKLKASKPIRFRRIAILERRGAIRRMY